MLENRSFAIDGQLPVASHQYFLYSLLVSIDNFTSKKLIILKRKKNPLKSFVKQKTFIAQEDKKKKNIYNFANFIIVTLLFDNKLFVS